MDVRKEGSNFCSRAISATRLSPGRKPASEIVFFVSLLSCYIMLFYAMLYCVVLCYVMLCYVVLCCVMLCYVMLCYVMLCYVMYNVQELCGLAKHLQPGNRSALLQQLTSLGLFDVIIYFNFQYYIMYCLMCALRLLTEILGSVLLTRRRACPFHPCSVPTFCLDLLNVPSALLRNTVTMFSRLGGVGCLAW